MQRNTLTMEQFSLTTNFYLLEKKQLYIISYALSMKQNDSSSCMYKNLSGFLNKMVELQAISF